MTRFEELRNILDITNKENVLAFATGKMIFDPMLGDTLRGDIRAGTLTEAEAEEIFRLDEQMQHEVECLDKTEVCMKSIKETSADIMKNLEIIQHGIYKVLKREQKKREDEAYTDGYNEGYEAARSKYEAERKDYDFLKAFYEAHTAFNKPEMYNVEMGKYSTQAYMPPEYNDDFFPRT